MRLYYLTPAQFGLSNIALRRLKISRLSQLNDPFELLAIDLREQNQRELFRGMKNKLDEDKGLLCFSKSWGNPVLWGHYADKHTGLALGFDVSSEHMKPVIYAKKPMKIEVKKESGELILTETVVDRLIRTKFHDWKYEDEVRVWVSLDHDTKESGLYFYPFDSFISLREIIIGSRCELPRKAIESLIEGFDPPVKVIQAKIGFDSFQVIEDKE